MPCILRQKSKSENEGQICWTTIILENSRNHQLQFATFFEGNKSGMSSSCPLSSTIKVFKVLCKNINCGYIRTSDKCHWSIQKLSIYGIFTKFSERKFSMFDLCYFLLLRLQKNLIPIVGEKPFEKKIQLISRCSVVVRRF